MITLEGKEKIIETKEMEVYKNALIYEDSVIQIKNIARISVSPIEKKPLPVKNTFIIGLIGIVLLLCPGALKVAGIIAIFAAIALFYSAWAANQDLGHYLQLELTSGKVYYFTAKNQEFLKSIMKVLGECMNDKGSNYIFNMEQATIQNMQVGDNNKML